MIKKVLSFLKKNWYAATITVVCFLIAIGVLSSWAGFGGPFLCGIIYGIYRMAKKL